MIDGRVLHQLPVFAYSLLLAAHPAAAQMSSTFLSGTTISGYIDTYYDYNRNHPSTPCATRNGVAIYNCLRAFDVSRDSFSLNLAALTLDKRPTPESRGGFHVDFIYGSGAELIAAQDVTPNAISEHLEQAYVSYLAAPHGSLQFDVGKFETPAGLERVDPSSDWNASRSLLFALAIPRDHVGIRAVYTPVPMLTVTGLVSNGWSDRTENGGEKIAGVSASLRPAGAVSVTGTYLGGPETSRDLDGWRDLFDGVITARVANVVRLAFNTDIGKDRRTRQTWQGAAAYVRFQISDWLAITPRVEALRDHEGFMTGIAQDLQEGTATVEFRPTQGALLRLEYRVDVADRPYFLENVSTTVRTQSIVAANCVFVFGSRSTLREEQ
jgi:hypothetical protein